MPSLNYLLMMRKNKSGKGSFFQLHQFFCFRSQVVSTSSLMSSKNFLHIQWLACYKHRQKICMKATSKRLLRPLWLRKFLLINLSQLRNIMKTMLIKISKSLDVLIKFWKYSRLLMMKQKLPFVFLIMQ